MLSDKVLITGCGGMLGEAVYPYFVSRYETVLASDKILNEEWLIQLDVRDDEHLRKVFEEYQPNLVIHLAAETSLEYCETHSKIAQDTNSTATKVIAKLSEEYGAVLVYISTAGVFDGLKKGFYTEQDQPNPIMVYGQTKYEGELHALEYCTRTFVVRAGWMMGGGKRKEKKFIYTYDFAKNLFLLIQTKKYGTYHMACEGKGARYDVAKEILRICKRPDIKLTAVSSEFFSREYFAPRPPSEMMYNVNLRKLGINNMNTWKDSLQNYIENYFAG
ncbi:MAG: SDR family oxidoreductase [Planctomycetota bacterium]|jgi:dTDP-4-dehydrorhamnose reductase